MTPAGQGLGQISTAVCAWVSEAAGLSPMGSAWCGFITERRVLHLNRGKGLDRQNQHSPLELMSRQL